MKIRNSELRRVAREARKTRIRRKVSGTTERPRMVVYRSLQNIDVQVVDDTKGMTLAAASSNSPELRVELKELSKKDAAKKVGALIAERCKAKGISKVVFDRNGFLYHGRVAALADGAREAGLEF